MAMGSGRMQQSYGCCLFIILLCFIATSAMDETSDIENLFVLRDSVMQAKAFLPSWFDSETPPCNWSGITCAGHTVEAIDLSSVPIYVPFPTCIGAFRSVVWLNFSRCGFSGDLPEALGNLQNLQYLDLSNNELIGPLPVSLYNLKMLKELMLGSNMLSGRLSPAIGQLQHLTRLSISKNSISGSLPPELGSLQNLEFLDLSLNSFTGPIPAAFCNLTRLLHLDASRNGLTGSIFLGISSLVNLLTLDLSSNSFVGPIPGEIGKLAYLECLVLGQNSFTGSIPDEIGNLKQLKILALRNCKFTGSIPRAISGLKSLKELDISENNFNGELPTSIDELDNLTNLVAKSAGLSGNIPKELGNCKKLTVINLSFNAFTGSLPEELSNLEAITTFFVEGNQLSGQIPDWFRNWTMVISIRLAQNMFTGPLPALPLQYLISFSADTNLLSGSIPAEVCQANSLQYLSLGGNNLTGTIEETFKRCMNLTVLNLLGNHLHGEIPEYLCDLPLVTLEMSQNNFSGVLPDRLWDSSTIWEISLSNNQLTGPISESIGRLSSLQRLEIDNNYLEGPIPQSIGNLRNLTNLSLHGNRLSGHIPLELFNCRNLVTLDLSSNNLSGHIPTAISHLTLVSLVLSNNQLSGAIPGEICAGFENVIHPDSEFTQHHGLLDLSYNQLSGQIPTAIKNCVAVRELHLQGNLLNGTIPEELGELTNLTTVDLSFNALNGPMIPWSHPLISLQGLLLSNNHLDGSIPLAIGSILPSIAKLDLSGNILTGTLPRSLLCTKSLADLDISNNHLSGHIPFSCLQEKEFFSSLLLFNASSNHFSGSLDESISNFTALSFLDIHNNSLTGSLPSAISDLSSLNYLDLSGNEFHGAIPCGICSIVGLTFANFSGNHIDMYSSADCAATGICATNSIIPKVVPPSPHVLRGASICAIALTVIIVLVLLVVGLRWKLLRSRSPALVPANKAKATVEPTSSDELIGKKSREPLSINLATFEHALLRVTADDILKATENFSKVHIIGDGGFGTVYRAALPEGGKVAIKRLHGGHQFQGDREFLAEMETIGKVKHPNLVPLLGYCVCGEERFLIYEYMEHGSLEMWLRNRADAVEALGWLDRLKICLGSARGLAFLHHGFVPHIIHRDMKSSNILLDENFEPRVSDFGLARIISACETHVSTDIAGTFGYIPPEYGLTMKSTAKGDVYSFGVVMLELLTGRPPTGQEEVEGGGNLVGWVRWMAAHRKDNEVFDPCLPVSGVWREQMVRVLAIAQDCTADEPWKRPTMLEVVKGLKVAQMMECGPLVVTVSRDM